MILRNSIPALSAIWNERKDNHNLPKYLEQLRNDPKINNANSAFIWAVWHTIPRETRDRVIAESIPKSEWIGGYPDITDSMIDALLRRVIKVEEIQD